LISALAGGECSASRPGCFTPGERAPGAHWLGGWVGLIVGKCINTSKFFTFIFTIRIKLKLQLQQYDDNDVDDNNNNNNSSNSDNDDDFNNNNQVHSLYCFITITKPIRGKNYRKIYKEQKIDIKGKITCQKGRENTIRNK
jgi:hypothetical protein